MKKKYLSLALGLSLLCGASAAFADSIPAPLAKSLKKLNLVAPPVLDGKTLIVAFKFDSIEVLQAKSAVETVCSSYLGSDRKKRSWKAGIIENIRVLNETTSQGYLYKGGDKSCEAWGKARGDDGDTLIKEHLYRVTTLNPNP